MSGRGPSAEPELLARVECRSEESAEQRPVAVWISGRRLAVDEIVDERVLGPLEAGSPLVRVVRLSLENGDRLRAERTLPDGRWRVYR